MQCSLRRGLRRDGGQLIPRKTGDAVFVVIVAVVFVFAVVVDAPSGMGAVLWCEAQAIFSFSSQENNSRY